MSLQNLATFTEGDLKLLTNRTGKNYPNRLPKPADTSVWITLTQNKAEGKNTNPFRLNIHLGTLVLGLINAKIEDKFHVAFHPDNPNVLVIYKTDINEGLKAIRIKAKEPYGRIQLAINKTCNLDFGKRYYPKFDDRSDKFLLIDLANIEAL